MASCRDAQDAVRGRDGYDFFGNRIRVELSNGSREATRGGGRGGGGGGGGGPPQTFRGGRGTGFRALVKGLPISCSWQDLKVGWGWASGLCLCCLAGVLSCTSRACLSVARGRFFKVGCAVLVTPGMLL